MEKIWKIIYIYIISKEYICNTYECITELLCCTPEANTTL